MQGPLKACELLSAGNTLSPLRRTARRTHPTLIGWFGDGRQY
jgi:hypothetical protein